MRRIFFCALLVSTSAHALAAPTPVLHHDLRVSLDPAAAALQVIDTVRFGPAEAPGDALNILLHRDLELVAVRSGDEELEIETLRRWKPRDFFDRPNYAELGAFSTARQHRVAAPDGGWPRKEFELEFEYAGAIYHAILLR